MLEEAGHFGLVVVSVNDVEAGMTFDDASDWLIVWLSKVCPAELVSSRSSCSCLYVLT